MSMPAHTLPTRDQVSPDDTWDLSSLYADDAAWEKDLKRLEKAIPRYDHFRGRLAESAETLVACLRHDERVDRLAERLGTYAFLKTTEDQANDRYQAMMGRYHAIAVRASEAASFLRPEILAIPQKTIARFLEDRRLKPYRLLLTRLRRFKPHTLTKKEERLLAMQGEMAQVASKTFRQLSDADLKFGFVTDENGQKVELTNATFSQLLHSPKRRVRKTAFHQYYRQFVAHENTLASLLAGSIHRDVYYARARKHPSALAAALFPDQVPQSVYDNLIATVRGRLPAVYRYFDLRRRYLRLKEIHHYDTYVPLLADLDIERSWDQAVQLVMESLRPLGKDYCAVLRSGLEGRWCDRYPNVGKQSGAFSCGTYDGDPYILMNYKPKVLDDIFTLAHEAGHSMHSYYSAKKQPYLYYDYTIFVAEVASTFNEQLLSRYLLEQAEDDRERAYLINREIDSMRATIVRQTMFAEFEQKSHAMAEAGEPLTVESFKNLYRGLLEDYFGPDFTLDDELSLECFRIPHFYRAFYVYKYATGMSAAIALSRRVLEGGANELKDYLRFLQGGCSKDPLDLLKDAGVDMTRPEPIATALDHFENLVEQLEQLL